MYFVSQMLTIVNTLLYQTTLFENMETVAKHKKTDLQFYFQIEVHSCNKTGPYLPFLCGVKNLCCKKIKMIVCGGS